MRSLIVMGAAIAVTASGAGAQIIRRPPGGDPPIILTSYIGFMGLETISDGSSGTFWNFGSAIQYRVSLEKRVGDRMSFGALVAYSSVPLVYGQMSGSNPPTTPCSTGASCSAGVDQTTIAASFSTGGSYGLHQIVNVSAGIIMYGDFRESGTGRKLAPLTADRDFFLSFGYGLGIGLSNRLAINIVQDYAFSVHQRTGLSGNIDSFDNISLTRLGLRLGVGR